MEGRIPKSTQAPFLRFKSLSGTFGPSFFFLFFRFQDRVSPCTVLAVLEKKKVPLNMNNVETVEKRLHQEVKHHSLSQ